MKSFLPGMNILLADYTENKSGGQTDTGTNFGEWTCDDEGYWWHNNEGPYDAPYGDLISS